MRVMLFEVCQNVSTSCDLFVGLKMCYVLFSLRKSIHISGGISAQKFSSKHQSSISALGTLLFMFSSLQIKQFNAKWTILVRWYWYQLGVIMIHFSTSTITLIKLFLLNLGIFFLLLIIGSCSPIYSIWNQLPDAPVGYL